MSWNIIIAFLIGIFGALTLFAEHYGKEWKHRGVLTFIGSLAVLFLIFIQASMTNTTENKNFQQAKRIEELGMESRNLGKENRQLEQKNVELSTEIRQLAQRNVEFNQYLIRYSGKYNAGGILRI